jgi:tryptophan halogenase
MSSTEHRHPRLKKIAIIGGGTTGWMTAAAFAKALIPAGYTITLVESDEIGTIGVGEATIPPIKAFNALLGFNEAEFLTRTQGTFKLGIEFINWGQENNRYMHPFGAIGVPSGPLAFYHYWLKCHLQGKSKDLGEYCMATQAALHNKFILPVSKPGTPLQRMDYAYHFDASLYARYLREYAEAGGVERVEGLINEVKLRENDGYIDSVNLQSGQMIDADFFIDCTGFKALLIEQALHTGYEDWSQYLRCDSAIAVQSHNVQGPRPYTRATAHTAGWQWEIPLQHRTGNGYVYASRYIDDESARNTLLNNISGTQINEPRVIRFIPGMRKKMWNKNCVALGLASGFIEPLESTSIHLIQSAIVKLISIFPSGNFSSYDQDQYNQMMADDYFCTRDFIILHYKATQRADSDFWRDCKAMVVPDSLKNKLELYGRNGRIFLRPNDIFKEESWISVLQGQGVVPQDYHPLADALSSQELEQYMGHIRDNIQKALVKMPAHKEFIAKYCAAARP